MSPMTMLKSKFTVQRPAPVYKQITTHLRDCILHGELAPGANRVDRSSCSSERKRTPAASNGQQAK